MSSPPYAPAARASLDGMAMGDAFGDSWFTLSGENVEEQWAARRLRPTPWQPLGAWFRGDPKVAAEQARLSALATHAHPEAVAGVVAVAVAAALAAAGAGHDAPVRAEFLREVAASVLGSGWRVSAPDTVPFALWAAAGHLDDVPEALWQTVGGWRDRGARGDSRVERVDARAASSAGPFPADHVTTRLP
ncbi:ADP-ribosylglycohydrolase family protein [Streptomyces sp. DSM 116496]|uniref:ADP-ribosylglycohydrolase family protein n=1 Tax=Streptomyces stoeckheimensis TaxID=3344656 RepID=UPI0038B315E6